MITLYAPRPISPRYAAPASDPFGLPNRIYLLLEVFVSTLANLLRARHPHPRLVASAIAAALMAHAHPSLADQPASLPANQTELSILTSDGPTLFRLDSPDLPRSPAARDDRTQTNPDGTSAGWTGGYTLTSRLVIRARSAADALAASAAADPALKVVPAAPAAGPGPMREFFFADAATIRAAASLASALAKDNRVLEVYLDIQAPRSLRNNIPTDPGVPQQWHLINTVTPLADTNVENAWKAGFTGTGITIGILEGGWQVEHEDLAANYHFDASQPFAGQSEHGTSTAGLAGAAGFNGLGGAGVAFNARLSRLYYGTQTQIAEAFGFRNDLNHIKTNSWGPSDNGRISTISSIELAALQDAVTNGRAGKGEILVWAAGNGGQFNNDRVDYDPYGSNRFSIAVGAVDALDRHSVYSEPGASLMLVTTSDYDLNTLSDTNIYTTSFFSNPPYTSGFGGTSAASPIAAGVCALVLQANPNLTWRDVQHVLIRSARKLNTADGSWSYNAAGAGTLHLRSDLYGFGAIDAGAAVALAANWTNRPSEGSLFAPQVAVNLPIPDGDTNGITSVTAVASPMLVERAQVTLTATHPSIGQLKIWLISPSGTQSLLAGTRSDTTFGGYNNYTFTTVGLWEERASGSWTIKIADQTTGSTGTFVSWQLKLHGYQPNCPCDWNLSGSVTVQDIFDFLSAFFNDNADFTGNGSTSIEDLFVFLDCWFAGC